MPFASGLLPPEIVLLRVIDSQGRRAEVLAGLAGRIRASPKVTTAVRDGRAADVFLGTASAPERRPRRPHDRRPFGVRPALPRGVAENVIRATSFLVLTLRAVDVWKPGPAGSIFERVLVLCDASDLAWREIVTPGLLAADGAAHVTRRGVVDASEPPDDPQPRSSRFERPLAREAGSMRERLEPSASRARGLGAETSVEFAIGPTAERIVTRAEYVGTTLPAMTTHGRRGLLRRAPGSLTAHALHATTVPLRIHR